MEPAHTVHPRPAWLTESCPSWCSGDHDGQNYPVDRLHLSSMTTIPVIERVRIRDAETTQIIPQAEPVEATVVIVQMVGDRDVWVAVGTETQQLEVTLESARRLHHHLARLLRDLDTSR